MLFNYQLHVHEVTRPVWAQTHAPKVYWLSLVAVRRRRLLSVVARNLNDYQMRFLFRKRHYRRLDEKRCHPYRLWAIARYDNLALNFNERNDKIYTMSRAIITTNFHSWTVWWCEDDRTSTPIIFTANYWCVIVAVKVPLEEITDKQCNSQLSS